MKIIEAKKLSKLSTWQRLISQQKASGLSIRCWCEQNALTEQQFYYRLRRVREAILDKPEPVPEVQLVRLPETEPNTFIRTPDVNRLIIVRHGTTSVEFPSDSDIQRIASFVRALEP